MGKRIPISGGGYLRLFPWILMKTLITQYLKKNDLYVFYIHPFELSNLDLPSIPRSASTLTKLRFSHGRKRVLDKITKLVNLLRSKGYSFTTFSEIHKEMDNSNCK